MTEEKSGIEKVREIAEKLKAEAAVEAEAKENKMVEAKNALATISENKELADMYRENAKAGAENLGGALPQLKVHAAGKSSTNELSDGTEPNDGFFFYKPTGEQFKELECHILTISRGYRAGGFQGKENVFHQILGGAIIDGEELKPFIMYFTGTRLSNLWDFGKEASKYTHAKPLPIPMFALTVKLSTESVKNNFGKNWIIRFEIVKTEDGDPKLVTDPKLFTILRENVETVESTISNLIDVKATEVEEVTEVTQESQTDIDESNF